MTKLLQIMGTLAFAASAFGQGIRIATPTSSEVLTIGQPFTMEIDQPDQLTGVQSVSVVIGLQSCGSSPCPIVDDDQILGQILYSGPYSSQRHEGSKPPYQNFTVTFDAQPGNAVVHVSHFFLLQAGPHPVLETKNVSVTLAQASGAKFRRGRL